METVSRYLSPTNPTSMIIDTGHGSLYHASTFLLISDSPWVLNPLQESSLHMGLKPISSLFLTLTHFMVHVFYGTLTHLVELWDSNPFGWCEAIMHVSQILLFISIAIWDMQCNEVVSEYMTSSLITTWLYSSITRWSHSLSLITSTHVPYKPY